MQSTKKPNILWICTDQQRFDTLGFAGNPYVHTPNLDRLAGEGAWLSNCFCQSPVCTPSRAAFLTGRYPVTSRCRQNGQDIEPSEKLVTRILADNGYHCGLSGKLHISACNPSLGIEMEPRIDDGYKDFHWSHDDGAGWGLHNEYHRWLVEQGAEYKSVAHPECRYIQTGMPEELGQTAWCVQKAIDFIDKRKDDGAPWLFSVNIFDPHHGFNPPAKALERYHSVLDELPLPDYVCGELADKPVWQQTDHNGAYANRSGFAFDEMSEKDHRWVKAAYWAMVDVIDRQVGRLLDALEKSGMAEDTVVIFTADHAEMLGDHGIYLKGPYFYDCLTRVPMIIRVPGIPAMQSDSLVELIDIAPTILDICGIDVPEGMQARSFLPLIEGKEKRHRDSVYCEFYGANFKYSPHAFTTMVRTDSYKLTLAHGQGGGELYDLKADPAEHTNLFDNPEYEQIKSIMLMELCNRMAQTADPLPLRKAMW